MKNCVLKFCGIRSRTDLLYCKKVGVDFVGVHVGNKDNTVIERERLDLLRYAATIGLRAIMVTKVTDKDLLAHCVEKGNPWGVQLHYDDDAQVAEALNGTGTRVFGMVSDNSDLSRKSMRLYEMIVYDTNSMGGTGVPNQLRILKDLRPYAHKVLLAGGVVPARVVEFKDSEAIAGFDVQSFLRKADKSLSFRRCQQLLFAADRYARGRISVSFTDYNVVEGLARYPYELDAVHEYHMDLFLEDEARRSSDMERLRELQDFPLSVHFIGGTEQQIRDFFDSVLSDGHFENVQSAVLLEQQGSWNPANTIRAWYYRDHAPTWQRRLTIIGSDDDTPEKMSKVGSVARGATYDELWLDRKLSVEKLKYYAANVPHGFNVVLGHHLHTGKVTFELAQGLLNRAPRS